MSTAPAVVLAGLAGAAAVPAVAALAKAATSAAVRRIASPAERLHRAAADAIAPLRRAGAEGVDPTRGQRRRLQLAFALAAFPTGWIAANAITGIALAAVSAYVSSRALVWRRERYVLRLAKGAGPAALAIADALSSGHSTRGSLTIAAGALEGPIAVELKRVAADLRLGAPTDAALQRFRMRATSRRIDLIVAAIGLQRRSGGNLAALLRDIAGTIEEQSRLEDEARAATSQARFTSMIVLGMPVALLALGELADPGMLGRVSGSPVGVSLLGAALILWLTGVVLVRKLGRISI
jgi:tight adherence protein B